jgi:chloride channel 7
MQFGLPVITTLFAARFVGNCFNEGIYDIHIHLNHYPFLDSTPPLLGTFLRVKHVMMKSPKCVRVIERAGILYDLLDGTNHNGFPVISTDDHVGPSHFRGLLLRKQLAVILCHKDLTFSKTKSPSKVENVLSWRQMEGRYPRYPDRKNIIVAEAERLHWVDLTPYMNQTPFLLLENAAFTRAYHLFRHSGLRHLIIVNGYNNVVGIVTRRDLEAEHCSRCFRLACLANENLYQSNESFSELDLDLGNAHEHTMSDRGGTTSSYKRCNSVKSNLILYHKKRMARQAQVQRALQVMTTTSSSGGTTL